jgi:transcriptional regulator with XRE-family HTH domain
MEDEAAGAEMDRRVIANLKAARLQAGLTQKQLAAQMRDRGWSSFEQQTITRYEAGQRRLTPGEADALAAMLGTDLLSLMRPVGIARQSGSILRAVRELLEARSQLTAAERRHRNTRAALADLVQQVRADGHAGELADELTTAERALRQEQ